jgi:hopanoid-associated phosphorylase
VRATHADPAFVLAVSGLAREAGIAAGPGVQCLVAGGGRIEALIESAIAQGATGLMSFGIAGGLDPALAPGTCILGREVIAKGGRWVGDPGWLASLVARLPRSVSGSLAGADAPVLTPSGKRDLHSATGAVAVDMESHVAARLAAARGLPFAALRVICDAADRAVPAAAIAGLGADGRIEVWAVVRSLFVSPGQMRGLLQLSRDAQRAFGELRHARDALGAGLGLPGFDS